MPPPVPFEVRVTLTVPADGSSADGMSAAVQQRVREAFARELGLETGDVQHVSMVGESLISEKILSL